MPVCIAGMHRSGTSMVAKLLHAAGLYLGPETDLLPGLRENKRFNNINQRILKRLGGSWDDPPAAPETWTAPALGDFRTEAEELLASFADREPWGWKDPRSCLTLPFWQGFLNPLSVVIIVRNPLEVAGSLRERNEFSLERGLALWYEYNHRLLAAAAASEHIVTHYDAYFEHPDREARRLLHFLGLSLDADTIAEASSMPRSHRRRHSHTRQDLVTAGVGSSVLDLYYELCRAAEWTDGVTGSSDSLSKPV